MVFGDLLAFRRNLAQPNNRMDSDNRILKLAKNRSLPNQLCIILASRFVVAMAENAESRDFNCILASDWLTATLLL